MRTESQGTNYYSFGMQMPGRSYSSNSYRYGFNGKEKQDEVHGNSGDMYDFGARIYDARIGRPLSTDNLAKETPNQSPYVYSGNNPILYIDQDGNFKLKYDEKMLAENGITKQDIVRFENIVKNIGNLIKDNPKALEAISNTTGFTKEQILSDVEFGKGPTVEIDYVAVVGAQGGSKGITFDPSNIKELAAIDPGSTEDLANQTLGTALTLLHEYGHYGDQTTNAGKNSGQYTLKGNKFIFDADVSGDPDLGPEKNTKSGKQKLHITATGHRGTDIEVLGFGVEVSHSLVTGKYIIQKGREIISSKDKVNLTPSSLPENASGSKILETLDVK